MPQPFRRLCIVLCLAFLAAVNLHGLSESRHEFGHASDWPAVTLVQTDDGQPAAHVHLAPDKVPDTDPDRDRDGPIPVGPHHHGGGDVHAAMPTAARGLTATSLPASAVLRPGSDPVRSSHAGDGPEHPPKQLLTVA